MEAQRSLNVRNPTKIHRKKDGKLTEKETAREPRKVESSKEEKAETNGKEKVKERKDNVSTKAQNHRRNSGQVDLGNNGQNNVGMLKQTLRIGGMMIGTQQIRILRPQRAAEKFQPASIGDLRLPNLGFAKHIESFSL